VGVKGGLGGQSRANKQAMKEERTNLLTLVVSVLLSLLRMLKVEKGLFLIDN
jgi:hypothetical protein